MTELEMFFKEIRNEVPSMMTALHPVEGEARVFPHLEQKDVESLLYLLFEL